MSDRTPVPPTDRRTTDAGNTITVATLIGGLLGETARGPLLTIIPIPYIRVDAMSINLNVSLHSTSSTSLSNDFAMSASTGGNFFVNFSVSVTDKNTYQFGSTVDDTYSLNVSVRAVQDTMPGGMAQVLGIFSSIITSQASLIQTLVTAEVQALTKAAQDKIAAAPPA
jgi:hypothetical protein